MYIEYGYDRKVKSWVTIVFDDQGKQIEASYDGNKVTRDFVINDFKKQYNITKVVKIKAY